MASPRLASFSTTPPCRNASPRLPQACAYPCVQAFVSQPSASGRGSIFVGLSFPSTRYAATFQQLRGSPFSHCALHSSSSVKSHMNEAVLVRGTQDPSFVAARWPILQGFATATVSKRSRSATRVVVGFVGSSPAALGGSSVSSTIGASSMLTSARHFGIGFAAPPPNSAR